MDTFELIETLDPASNGRFVGNHGFTIYVLGYGSSTAPIEAFPTNHAPVAVVAPVASQTECTGLNGAAILLDGSGSTDEDSSPGTNDDIVSFEWYADYGGPAQTLIGSVETLTLDFAVGAHSVTLVVTDTVGQTDAETVAFEIVDTTAPGLSVTLDPDVLWPPNHHMVDVEATLIAGDLCAAVTVELRSVTSSEPDDEDGNGDGKTVDDIQGDDPGTPDTDFRLRAERAGSGPGRVYMATYAATDAAGNETVVVATVTVPHDQDGTTDPVEVTAVATGAGVELRWAVVQGALQYDVIRGGLAAVRDTGVEIDLGAVTCIEAASTDTTTAGFEDATIPASGEVDFYLVGYYDGAHSHYGSESVGRPRVPAYGGCDPP